MTPADPDPTSSEQAGVDRLGARLEARRPAPPAAFRGDLGRALDQAARRRRLRPRPANLWAWVVALAAAGVALLGAAAGLS